MPHRPVVWLLASALIAVAAALGVHAVTVRDAPPARPDLQRILNGLVTGRGRVAPGVSAYVSGPHGTWIGSAGLADIRTGQPMWPGAVMHIDSNSKAWTAVLILQMVGEGRMSLADTVERWLPGLLPYGNRITVHQLLNHTSGLIDDNDVTLHPMRYLRRVHDPALRARLLDVLRRQQADPTIQAPPMLAVKLAAAQPLRTRPGRAYHYSNIGYDILGMIAARVGGAPLPELYQRRIIQPLGLTSAVYQPQGEIAAPHPREYSVHRDGSLVDATGWYRYTEGAGAGIRATAADEGRFLAALMGGRLLRPAQLAAMKTPTAASQQYGLGITVLPNACGGRAFQHGGASYATTSMVVVSGDGRRVAVILLNGNTLDHWPILDPRSGRAELMAILRLYCAS